MHSYSSSTSPDTLQFGLSDVLGIALKPMAAPQRGTTGFRRTVRLTKELKETAATIATMPPDQRPSAVLEKVGQLLGAPYGRARINLPNQIENNEDVGTIFIGIVKSIYRVLAQAQQRNELSAAADSDEFSEVERMFVRALDNPTAPTDIRTGTIEALMELLAVAGFITPTSTNI